MAAATGTLGAHDAGATVYEARLKSLAAAYPTALAQSLKHISFGDDDGQLFAQYSTGLTGNLYHSDLGFLVASTVPELSGDFIDSGYQSLSMELLADILADTEILVRFGSHGGGVNPRFQPVLDSSFLAATPVIESGQLFDIVTSVHGYESALEWLKQQMPGRRDRAGDWIRRRDDRTDH